MSSPQFQPPTYALSSPWNSARSIISYFPTARFCARFSSPPAQSSRTASVRHRPGRKTRSASKAAVPSRRASVLQVRKSRRWSTGSVGVAAAFDVVEMIRPRWNFFCAACRSLSTRAAPSRVGSRAFGSRGRRCRFGGAFPGG